MEPTIHATIQHIEQNIADKIVIDTLSAKHYVSPRQLYREFYAHTGHSINEYVRKRRLSRALNLLKYSQMTITDIAYSCGYSSVQALCRSIKSSFNMTPTQYRNGSDVYYFPLYDGIKAQQIIIQSQTIPQMIGIRYHDTQPQGIENRAISYLQQLLPNYTGRLFGRNGPPNCYELFIEDLNILKNADIAVQDSYTAVFACSAINNNGQNINTAWDFLYGHWLKNSMFQQDDIPYFEEYIIKDHKIKKLVLYLPIKQRENFYKINFMHFGERVYIAETRQGDNAEKAASNAVVDYIAAHYPFLLKTQKEFYVAKTGDTCTCGIGVNSTKTDSMTVPKGLYAVLEGSCYGSGNEYEQFLLCWLRDNGIEVLGKPFSIYDTSKGTKQNEIIVKSQVAIKSGRI